MTREREELEERVEVLQARMEAQRLREENEGLRRELERFQKPSFWGLRKYGGSGMIKKLLF